MSTQAKNKVLLVVGQGRSESLCHHILRVIQAELEKQGKECRVHDPLADGFDPVLRLGPDDSHASQVTAEQDPVLHRYQQDAKWAAAYVFVHPVWWFAPPAILKGWIEKVMCEGVGVDYSSGLPKGLLEGRTALLIQTFKALRVIDSVLTRGITAAVWRRGFLAPLGIHLARRIPVYSVGDMDKAKLAALEKRLRKAARDLVE
ncbi:MAG: hypothetical protein GY930_17430 [bacterium]|nr:hypothetical protein [bacterium]